MAGTVFDRIRPRPRPVSPGARLSRAPSDDRVLVGASYRGAHIVCFRFVASCSLADLGWDDAWAATLATAVQLLGPADPARVARVDLGACTVLGTGGPRGRPSRPGRPSPSGTGSWSARPSSIGALPRRTAIVRRSAGLEAQAQTLAANVDTVLVLVAADGRVTPRSIERYVTLVWESGATPVVVLTKADLVSGDELDDALERLEPACVGVDLLAISAPTGAGLDGLAPVLRPRPDGGPARLVRGGEVDAGQPPGRCWLLATGAVREGDHRGRHTTTHRELVRCPAAGSSSTRQVCGRSGCGTLTKVSPAPSRRSPPCSTSAASPTARIGGSRGAR